jgi:hypothetical protein
MKIITYAAFALSFSCLTTGALAEDLKITDINGTELKRFSKEQVEALGTRELRTSTPWTEGTVTFTGVDGEKLLTEAGYAGATVTAIALDDYAIALDWEDFEKHNALIATRMNGENITSGNKGPFWIVFDYDDLAISEIAGIQSKSVWHLVELEIE